MAITDHERIGKALERLKPGLQPFVERGLKSTYKDKWIDAARPSFPNWQQTGKPGRCTGAWTLLHTRTIATQVRIATPGLEGARRVAVTLDIGAEIPSGAPDNVVCTVTENCRRLKFENSWVRGLTRIASSPINLTYFHPRGASDAGILLRFPKWVLTLTVPR
jgi:hypothetical protein